MGFLTAIMSEITCGEACWNAKGDICHCECGGKNHGINLSGGTAERTSKIDGVKYKLQAVGTHRQLQIQAHEINTQIIISTHWDYSYKTFRINKREDKDKGAAARVKYAGQHQIDKWKELEAFKGKDRYQSDAALLWVRVDIEEIKAQSIVLTDDQLKAAKLMKDFSPAITQFVWYHTLYSLIGNVPISTNRVWETNKDFHLEILKTIDRFEFEIAKMQNENGGCIDGGYQDWITKNINE